MFIIIVSYKKPITEVDKYLISHRLFLDNLYSNNCLIASGPQRPRTGGILISQLDNKTELENILNNDPFKIQGIADYQIIEFEPVKYHSDFDKFISLK